MKVSLFLFQEVEMSDFTGDFEEGDMVSDATELESLGSMNDYDLLKDKTQKLKIIDDSGSVASS